MKKERRTEKGSQQRRHATTNKKKSRARHASTRADKILAIVSFFGARDKIGVGGLVMAGLLDLPDELLLAILRRAIPQAKCVQWLAAATGTCRHMRHLWDDDALWQPVLACVVGSGPASAACTGSTCKQLVRLVASTTVDMTVTMLRDQTAMARAFDGVRVTLPPDLARVRRSLMPLTHAPTLALLALRAAGVFSWCLGRTHVWLASHSPMSSSPGSHSWLRPIHIAGAQDALYPDDALWWWNRWTQAMGPGATIAVHIVIASAEVTRALAVGRLAPPAFDVVPVTIPVCVRNLAQQLPLDAPFPVVWYAPESCTALGHLTGCVCR
ncbi:F-box domain protein [Pandoravirus inopinatum]|uniref:F-box domain protein n=1 Tax=Pandoravirus inopinatum TaxID=1605721 RepID=A0A0B5J8A7_9VIRU|nr:F-box domain protein [Pandoravirus inopinatum]AJF97021.1 F-box domain protein [Pandoravirus inopinatum]